MKQNKWNMGMIVALALTVLIAIPALATEPAELSDDQEVQTLNVSVESITLDQSACTLQQKGQTVQLEATVSPAEATDASVTWTSDKESVATVDSNGLVTAVADGTATITATSNENSAISAACVVTVSLQSDTSSASTATIEERTVNGVTGWWYVNAKGKVDQTYTGFGTNKNGDWYVENGKVTKKTNGVYQDTTGAIGEKNAWYYVLNSKVQYDFTGLADYKNASGWWYITKGKVDRSVTTVAKNKNGWWYVQNGKVNRGYTGFGTNSSGSWYAQKGKVTKKANGVYKDTTGALGAKNAWYYVLNSKVQYSFTGLANYKNASGWWYITNGKVDRSYNGLAKNKNGWYYLKNGKVDRSFTGTAQNSNGWWYVKKGTVDRSAVALVKTDGVWKPYVRGKLSTTYTGIAANENGWWYVDNGTLIREDCLTYAARFVGTNTSSSKSASSKLATCYKVLWSTYLYVRTYGDSHEASAMSQYAVDMFKNKKGNCLRYAASFACIAKVLGYDARVGIGQISSARGGMTSHGWTEVKVDGQWLICDADMQMNHPNVNVYMRTTDNFPYRLTCSARYEIKVSSSGVVWK